MAHASVRRSLANAAVACMPGGQRRIPSAAGIAVTFDDGPHPLATPRALDALEQAGLRATFFVLADNARKHPAILERCMAEGHDIALHGCTHAGMALLGRGRLRARLEEGKSSLEQLCGRAPQLFRPPYGRWNPARNSLLRGLGMRLVLWNRSPAEYLPSMHIASATAYLRASLKAGDILLLHDNAATAADIGSLVEALAGLLRERRLEALPVIDPLHADAGGWQRA